MLGETFYAGILRTLTETPDEGTDRISAETP